MEEIVGFKPIVDKSSNILILGSIPSEASLKKQQYYAHPRNQFWTIMSRLLTANIKNNYSEKTALLKKSGIALWDVIGTCKRKGSLDSNIKEEQVNDIPNLLERYKNIRTIFCNGGTAFRIFGKKFKSIDLPLVCLPSTSPAYTKSIDWKLKKWEKLLDIVKQQPFTGQRP